MSQIDVIYERLRENEQIHRKFNLLESRMIATLNFRDFFECLITEMAGIFDVPRVWLTVIEESHLADLIRQLNDSEIIGKTTCFIKKSDFDAIIGAQGRPLLFNSDMAHCRSFFPDGRISSIRSLALTPVTIDGEVVGSLNQGDTDPARYEPDMDTSYLEQLMLKISLCLSNVAAHEKLRFYAYHDPLTNLLNRRAFEAELERETSRCARHGQPLSLVFMDVDAFKDINDGFGHETGDMALKYVADALTGLSRKEDIVARFAGDEFVVILPETPPEMADAFMKRVQDYLDRHPLFTTGALFHLAVSHGVASMADSAPGQPDLLVKKADERLYRVKEDKRRNRRISKIA